MLCREIDITFEVMTTIYYCMHGVHKIYVIITKYLYYESFKEEKEKKTQLQRVRMF